MTDAQVLTGADVLERIDPALDELHADTRAPVTARRPWLAAWLRCHPGYEPRALLVHDSSARLAAAALLVRRKRRLITEYFPLGTGLSDQARFPARDAESAQRLARAVVTELDAAGGPWSLRLRHFPPGDAVIAALAAELPSARVERGDASPTLRFGEERSLRAHVSKNHHQQVRRMLNRMRSEGLEPEIEYLRARAAIAAVLPEVEDVCIRRDIELRGMSLFERAPARAFLREVTLAHAESGEVELTTLRLRGELAAYVLCFLDGAAYRMWNCRLAPEWGRYGVGRVANDAALQRALADPRAHEFDWMRGDEAYKRSMSNHVEHAQDLWAWSSPALRALLDSPRRVKGLVKSVLREHEWLQPALTLTRRLKSAGRRQSRWLSTAPGDAAP